MIIDPPYADGILFDDIFYIADPSILIARGVVFATTFKVGERRYEGNIIAESEQQAKDIAFGRALGETVEGQLVHQEIWKP